MFLLDVNVLVYAHRSDVQDHAAYRDWPEKLVNSEESYGISDLVLSRFLLVVTHPRIFQRPTPLETALAFVKVLRDQPNCTVLSPGERHWSIFTRLCQAVGAKGNLVSDAYLAALAIESGSEWITTDQDYSRFPGLRWRHPLKAADGEQRARPGAFP